MIEFDFELNKTESLTIELFFSVYKKHKTRLNIGKRAKFH